MQGYKPMAATVRLLSIIAMFCAAPVQAQWGTPALCPPRVSPGVIAYPRGIIPFSDRLNSGDFVVSYLEYNRLGGLSPYAVYTPYPAPPVDIVNPYKSWTLAAIYAQCYYFYPPGPTPWLIVEEYNKLGRVTIENPNCGYGGGSGTTYDAYEAIYTDGAAYGDDCDDGGTPVEGGGGDEICAYLNLDPGCYDVYIDGAYSETVCC